MSENQAPEGEISVIPDAAELTGIKIRTQLLWASLFPLVFFALLVTLVTFSAFNELTRSLILQRNTAQVQVVANTLARGFSSQFALNSALQSIEPVADSRVYVIDQNTNLIASSAPEISKIPINPDDLDQINNSQKASTQVLESTDTREVLVVSYARIPGKELAVIITEPWAANIAPASYYQLILVGLLMLGTVLSLGMLSLSIGRAIRPITMLVKNASDAVPGSTFHPVPLEGPQEIRSLINSFNQMVIRLAEQQSTLRQYAHKALLSQEEERLRLSHELHDGILQDLVGLVQRVELCRIEMDRDPNLARLRLEELHNLLEETLNEIRRISNALRPSVLEDLGLPVAVESLCKELEQDKPGIRCEFTCTGNIQRLMPDLELAIYRVVQEALVNIRKHAKKANLVQVELTFADAEIQVRIINNGAVFATQEVRSLVRAGHLGLAGMYERASLFGGKLTITSDPRKNTIVSLKIPSQPAPTLDAKGLSSQD